MLGFIFIATLKRLFLNAQTEHNSRTFGLAGWEKNLILEPLTLKKNIYITVL